MKIESKYSLGDKVWVIIHETVSNRTIRKINIILESNKFNSGDYARETITYSFDCYLELSLPEERLFSTKQELIDSL